MGSLAMGFWVWSLLSLAMGDWVWSRSKSKQRDRVREQWVKRGIKFAAVMLVTNKI